MPPPEFPHEHYMDQKNVLIQIQEEHMIEDDEIQDQKNVLLSRDNKTENSITSTIEIQDLFDIVQVFNKIRTQLETYSVEIKRTYEIMRDLDVDYLILAEVCFAQDKLE